MHLLTVYCTCIDIVIGALGSTMGQTLLYLTEEVLKKKERKKEKQEREALVGIPALCKKMIRDKRLGPEKAGACQ